MGFLPSSQSSILNAAEKGYEPCKRKSVLVLDLPMNRLLMLRYLFNYLNRPSWPQCQKSGSKPFSDKQGS